MMRSPTRLDLSSRSRVGFVRTPLLLGCLLVSACDPVGQSELNQTSRNEPDGVLSVAEALGGAGDREALDAGFARAYAPRSFVFPDDHGAHPEFRIEWWYVTGHLQSASTQNGDQRPFGFQLTFFRSALRPASASTGNEAGTQTGSNTGPNTGSNTGSDAGSAWATDQFYFAHFAVTDPQGERFIARSRSQRGAAGLAGARADPFEVWVGPWRAQHRPLEQTSATPATAGDSLFPLHLDAEHPAAAIDLTLTSERAVTLHGDRGLSRKGRQAGNASYYLSWTRCPAEGLLRLGDEEFQVMGTAWIDREWSTSVLPPGIIGWDWFSLQLDDGRDLMIFQLRDETGKTGEVEATLIGPEGTRRLPKTTDVRLRPGRRWTSDASGASYPVEWSIEIPSEDLFLSLEPLLDAQELTIGFRYWEGAMRVRATTSPLTLKAESDLEVDLEVDLQVEAPIVGRGYLEMTGYEAESGS